MYDPPKSDAVVPARQTSEEARIGTFIEPMRLWHATRGASRLIAKTVLSFGALGAVCRSVVGVLYRDGKRTVSMRGER